MVEGGKVLTKGEARATIRKNCGKIQGSGVGAIFSIIVMFCQHEAIAEDTEEIMRKYLEALVKKHENQASLYGANLVEQVSGQGTGPAVSLGLSLINDQIEEAIKSSELKK